MATYGVTEFKARFSEILRNLDDGEDVIITRRGKPCGRFTPMRRSPEDKLPLSALRGILADRLPDLDYQEFLDIKKIWEPRIPPDAADLTR